MPLWNLFAFDASSAASHVLTPLLQAVRSSDLSGWQEEFKKLQLVHRRSSMSPYGGPYPNNKPITSVEYYHGEPGLSENAVPQESSPALRCLVQEFVEAISPHYLRGAFFRLRSWVVGEVSWPRLLVSNAERLHMALFQHALLGWPDWPEIPDPFGFLNHTSATDSTYVSPAVVKHMAETEQTTGLFRRLLQDTHHDKELHALARDLASIATLIELAANQSFGLYYREDGT
jgi:hypothetical protein